jgi:hypothetical protein
MRQSFGDLERDVGAFFVGKVVDDESSEQPDVYRRPNDWFVACELEEIRDDGTRERHLLRQPLRVARRVLISDRKPLERPRKSGRCLRLISPPERGSRLVRG